MKIATILLIIVSVLIIGLFLSKCTIESFYEENKFRVKESSPLQTFYKKNEVVKPYKQEIPFIIHQTYFTSKLNMDILQTCMTIKNMNPEYNYAFYDDKQCREYIKAHYPPHYLKAYDMVIPGAYKADVFRYLLLFREGGVYMDCKSSTILPLRDFIPHTATFAVFRDRPKGSLLNSFMAVTANHPILKIVIDLTIDNILNKRYNNNSLDITGPQTLGRAFNIFNGRPELEDIEPGVYGKNRDLVILGSFYVIGEGDNEFDALVDPALTPLVAKTLKNYYNNPNRIDYHALWTDRKVFKDV
jgi:mannosyltransferase OCH1-like enzyme